MRPGGRVHDLDARARALVDRGERDAAPSAGPPGSVSIMRVIAAALAAVVGGLILLGHVAQAAAQTEAEVARLLRVEWEAPADAFGPPRLAGVIYNESPYRIGSVRLRVQTLDASGQVLRESLAWVYVTVPARGRAPFSLRRPRDAERFRLGVESFVLIAREEIHETP
jgi:hypothetical protein